MVKFTRSIARVSLLAGLLVLPVGFHSPSYAGPPRESTQTTGSEVLHHVISEKFGVGLVCQHPKAVENASKAAKTAADSSVKKAKKVASSAKKKAQNAADKVKRKLHKAKNAAKKKAEKAANVVATAVEKVSNKVSKLTKLPLNKVTRPVTKFVKSITSHHAVTKWETLDNGLKVLVMRPHFHGSRLFDNMDKSAFVANGQWSRVTLLHVDGSDANFELLNNSIRFVPKSDVPHRGDGWRRYPGGKDKEPIALGKWFQWDKAAGKDYAMYLAGRVKNMQKGVLAALAAEKSDTPNVLFFVELAPPGWKPPANEPKQ